MELKQDGRMRAGHEPVSSSSECVNNVKGGGFIEQVSHCWLIQGIILHEGSYLFFRQLLNSLISWLVPQVSNLFVTLLVSQLKPAYNNTCICVCVCVYIYIYIYIYICCRSQWPRGLSRRSTAARLLRLWVRIPPRAWMFVCCECCVLSGRGLCDELITRPGDSY